MHPFKIDGRTYLLNQVKQSLPIFDLLRWLENNSVYPKVFWRDRDGQITRAAVGSLFSFPYIPRFSETVPFEMRLYGGIRFSEKCHHEDTTWCGLPRTCFWLPQIELTQKGKITEAMFYSLNENPSLDIGALDVDTSSQPPLQPYLLLDRIDTPNFPIWKENVGKVLKVISSGVLDKLVLARKTTLQFSQPISIRSCLNHLVNKAKSATLFAFQFSPSLCFLGATPEKLFERTGNELNTDILAGTRPRGSTPEEDIRLEKELLNSLKEQREFTIVKEFLQQVVCPLSQEMQWDKQDRVFKASHVQHIHNRLNATLKGEISDAELIEALHPTPALGGYPREIANLLLKQIEPFDRGWYGGPIGVIRPKGASLHVAIRSALIRQNSLHLFAGTGIVQGSVPEQEWNELEQKIRPFTELFLS